MSSLQPCTWLHRGALRFPILEVFETLLDKTLSYLNPDLRLDNLQITSSPKLLYHSDTLKRKKKTVYFLTLNEELYFYKLKLSIKC